MKITRTPPHSGKTRTLDLPITEEQWKNYQSGMHIQRAMPHLSAADREFIISGVTQQEWNELFPKEEDDDET